MQFEPQGGNRDLKSSPNVISLIAVFGSESNDGTRCSWLLLATLALGIALIAIPARAAAVQTANSPKSVASSSAQSNKQPDAKAEPRHHARRHINHKRTPEVAAPPAPPAPVPPAQQAAVAATIDYRDGQLRIDAQNSSLVQILTKISQETGLVVDGLGHDQRIYGQYGPGPVETTLSSLLDGAGYNYVLVGNVDGQGAAKLLLTPRSGDGAGMTPAPAATPVPVSGQATATPQMANPSEPPHPKTPQEIFDELRKMHPQ